MANQTETATEPHGNGELENDETLPEENRTARGGGAHRGTHWIQQPWIQWPRPFFSPGSAACLERGGASRQLLAGEGREGSPLAVSRRKVRGQPKPWGWCGGMKPAAAQQEVARSGQGDEWRQAGPGSGFAGRQRCTDGDAAPAIEGSGGQGWSGRKVGRGGRIRQGGGALIWANLAGSYGGGVAEACRAQIHRRGGQPGMGRGGRTSRQLRKLLSGLASWGG